MNANVVDVRNTFSEYLNRELSGRADHHRAAGQARGGAGFAGRLGIAERPGGSADVKAAKKARKEKGGVTREQYRRNTVCKLQCGTKSSPRDRTHTPLGESNIQRIPREIKG